MDEMKLLEDFCAAEPPPRPQRLARARSRLVAAIGGAGPAGSGPGTRRARWRPRARALSWPQLAVAGAAVSAAAAIAVAATVASPTAGPPAGNSRPATHLAAYVLRRAAAAALVGPVPRGNQFIYTDTRTAGRGSDVLSQIQAWQSVDGKRAGAWRWTKCEVPSGRVPHVKTRVLPSCLAKLPAGRFSQRNPLDRTYAGLRTLPTRPGAMLAWLKRHNSCDGPGGFGLPKDIAAYAEIVMILDTVQAPPPKAAAALFGAAAKISGVTVLPNVTDAAGGHGIAVSMTFTVAPAPRTRYELIFDLHTYRFIGSQRIAVRSAHRPGTLVGATALITSKVVNAAPANYTRIGKQTLTGGTPVCV